MTEPNSTILHGFIDNLRQKPILLGALLVLATLLLYGPVTHHEFLTLDDRPYVTKNIHVSTGLNLGNVAWAFTSFHASNWHPLTWLSHMADCQLFGLSSGPHHFINVVLHAVNALLLFWLLQTATGAVWRSFLVAALFAVHPLNVETVAWVAQRKSLLCTFFSLLMIAAYGWYVRGPDWKKYLVVGAGFALALLSKPMAVSLPLVLLLLDYWPLERYEDLPFRRKWVRLSLEKLPLLLLSAASSAVTTVAQRFGGAVADASVLPLSVRLENAIVCYVAYLGKTVWPAKLAVFYPHPWHLALVRRHRGGSYLGSDHVGGAALSPRSLSGDGLVSLCHNADSSNRNYSGRPPSHGRPLRLRSLHRPFYHRRMGLKRHCHCGCSPSGRAGGGCAVSDLGFCGRH